MFAGLTLFAKPHKGSRILLYALPGWADGSIFSAASLIRSNEGIVALRGVGCLLGGQHTSLMKLPERPSRRRLIVFCGTFIFACAASLGYVYSQPPEYRAVARVQISPAGLVAEATDAKSPGLQGDPKSFLTEVEVLTSRPLLEETVARLRTAGKLPDLGKD